MGEPSSFADGAVASPDTERSRALTRQANALRAEGRWQEALPLCFAALQADNNNAAAAHNLGVLLSKIGRLAEGEAAFRHALSLSPGVPLIIHALAHNLMAQGRYAEGWPLYAVREQMPELNTGFPTNFPFPRWRGEPLEGKRLAIFPEQGLGDQIQFARFLPPLLDQAAAVTLLTMRPLDRLYRHNFPQAEIVLADGKVEFPDPDYWVTLYDLAAVLKIGVHNIPTAPYLRPPEAWPPLGDGFKIGLKTKGNPAHTNDTLRSMPNADAELLRARLPGRVISLEPQDSGARDMADTAAMIDQLDLVVSVDTSVGHLAGAMGKPCLLLLPGFSVDWRWMIGREDSLWYPGHRLFRSEQDGNWRPAIDSLVAEARKRAEAQSAMPPQGKDESLAQAMHRAKALRDEARYSEALDLMRRIVRRAPDNAGAVSILGTMLRDIGRLEEAELLHRRALALAPNYPGCSDALAYTLLAQGEYREAWPLHKARSKVSSPSIGFPTDMPCPRWNGEPLDGKHIVVMPEQGFGDQMQFARFLPMLQSLGPKISLFTPLALTELFRSSFPEVTVRSAEGQVPLGKPDYWTTLVDMAQPLDVTIERVASPPYLRTTRSWAPLPAGFKIGLQTGGNSKHSNDSWRSLPPEAVERLRSGLPGQIIDLDPVKSSAADFADTAALIEQLDLIVSVDTSVAHLAGALGKPCFLLIPGLATDWRWMRDRDDSPWYPGHRLFRSAMDASWNDAIDRLVAEVERLRSAEA